MRKKWIAMLLVVMVTAEGAPALTWAGETGTNVELPGMEEEEYVAAESGSCGDSVTYELDGEGTLVISGNGEMWENNSPFQGRYDIKKAVVEEGVTSIGNSMFSGCYMLTEISLPNSLTSIGNFAFCESSIKSLTIPEEVTSIGLGAFEDSDLIRISIPAKVASMDAPFRMCCDLSFIEVDKNNMNYSSQDGVLFDKSQSTLFCYPPKKAGESYGIAKSVKKIEDWAFLDCRSLKNIDIPEGLTEIGEGAFADCTHLRNVKLPKNMEKITDSIFSGCSSLEDISIPEHVASIGDSSFYDCISLKNIVLPTGVKQIGSYAFSDCINLKEVIIPQSVTRIREDAFCRCRSLTDISLPQKIEELEEEIFYECSSLCGIAIPENVKSIGYNAFAGCENLTDITLPESVTSIGSGAFGGCVKLESAVIPKGVERIETGIFANCSSLKKIEVAEENPNYCSPGGVLLDKEKETLINYPAAKSGSYKIPESVKNISESAFAGCSGLQEVILPEGVTEISWSAFFNCSSLKNIYIPASLTVLMPRAFDGCSSLEAFNVSEDNMAYRSQDGVLIQNDTDNLIKFPEGKGGSYRIPDSVRSVSPDAFFGCVNLESVEIPEHLEAQPWAFIRFENCGSLCSISVDEGNMSYSSEDGVLFDKNKEQLYKYPEGRDGGYRIPDGVKTIGAGAFVNCAKLDRLTIPKSVVNTQYGEGSSFGGRGILSAIEVDEKNSKYSSDEGILFDKEQKALLRYPSGRSGDYWIGEGTEMIGEKAFSGCVGIVNLYIPDSVTRIGSGAFSDCGNLVIHCSKYSEAYFTALKEQIPFVIEGGEEEKRSYIVTFDVNGGEELRLSIKTVDEGEVLGALPAPKRDGYTFKGWFTAKTGGSAVSVNTVVTSELTVYAQWEIIAKEPDKGGMEGGPQPIEAGANKYETSDGETLVYTGSMDRKKKKVTIPSSVKVGEKTYKVTAIAAGAFKNSKVTGVTIGSNIRSIGKDAFRNCKKLKTIVIKSTKLKSVGKNAFKGVGAKVKMKVPKKKLSAYKKLFRKRGLSKKVKFKK